VTELPPQADAAQYLRGRQALIDALRAAREINLKPPPKLTLSEWAARYAFLSPETSAQTGRFRSFAYQDGIMDAVTDPAVEKITVKKSARVGYTKILDHICGYHIHQDPSPILVVQPRVEDAEDYSATEIEPMLRDTPVLKDIAGELRAKDGKQKLLKRVFRNGSSITFVGANSPGGFRRITTRIVLFDEVDGYPVGGAGSEGDQIKLGIKRSESFWNRKIVLGSTPTNEGVSRIDRSWRDSDQRLYFVPCPQCGHMQTLTWGGDDVPYGIKWRRDDAGRHLPETAFYLCANGCVIEEVEKPGMIARGEWRATKPFNGHAGFHIWAGYSLFVNAAWSKLVAEWLEVKSDPLARKTFTNLVLGEVYEDCGDKAMSERTLVARTEVWPGEVPWRAAVLTAAGDVQDDRVEIEIAAWGANEERWSIAHEVIEGDPDTPALWDQVDAFLKRKWHRADGREFAVAAACIDSGGHHTQRVYEFCKQRIGRHVWAVKGESARGGLRSPVWPTKRPSSRNKSTYRPIIIGVNAAKDVIRARLHLAQPKPDEACPGYMHYPADRDINFFAQLISERLTTKARNGQRYRVWELPPGRANEALDLAVYSYAALCGLMHMGLKLNRRAEAIESDHKGPVPASAAAPEFQGPVWTPPAPAASPKPRAPEGPTIQTAQPARQRRSFVGRFAGA
jgi:phage terminase large subunit GpA-like protein